MVQQETSLSRVAVAGIALAACLFVLLSLISFDVRDWPNPDAAPARVEYNWCGRAGAWLAYYAEYYLGPASLPLLAGVMAWWVLWCMQKPVEQLPLRIIGVLLVGAALAACWFVISPGSGASLSHGNGGVLGIALGHFLLTNAALTGTVLVLAAALLVGLILAADNVLLLVPGLLLRGADRLRQAGPVLARLSAPSSRWRRKPRSALEVTSRGLTLATPQREAAIREVARLDQLARARREGPARPDEKDVQTPSLDTDAVVAVLDEPPTEGARTAAVAETGASTAEGSDSVSSVQAVSSALVKLKAGQLRPTPPAGAEVESYDGYTFPPLSLLEEPVRGFSALQEKVVREKGHILEQTLRDFHIDAQVVEAETGPVITMFELQLAPGIKVAQISNLANDLARSLGAPAVRVVAPISGKHTIGIEVPNSEKEKVRIKELLQLAGEKAGRMSIPLFLGKDAAGEALCADLTELPHLLIAGTTGSGKSVCLGAVIMSILLTQRPDLVKVILVDPKMVEMNAFRDLPHLMCPIVTEMKRAEQILEWLTIKMDERYALLAEGRVRNVTGYNQLTAAEIYERFCPSCEEEKAKIPLRLPYIVVVIDELADLMMTSAKEVEGHIIRLAQKSRAVGIHIVLATQRPQATVVTGLIKSNLPSRISFRVAARMDSRIVLDQNGAEALLGQGDMLFLRPGTSELIRAQGTFLSEGEIQRVVEHVRTVAQAHFHPELMQLNQADPAEMEKDDLFDEAVKVVLETGRGSVSLLQRRLNVGYSRASRLIDQMALVGIVGEYKGSQAREVMITPEEYEEIRRRMEAAAEAADDAALGPEAATPGESAAGAALPGHPAQAAGRQTPRGGFVEADEDDNEDSDVRSGQDDDRAAADDDLDEKDVWDDDAPGEDAARRDDPDSGEEDDEK